MSYSQASKIIDSNKRCFVLRKHDDEIDRLEASLTKMVDDHIVSFVSDKFSIYALCSENKPISSTKNTYSVPVIGVDFLILSRKPLNTLR